MAGAVESTQKGAPLLPPVRSPTRPRLFLLRRPPGPTFDALLTVAVDRMLRGERPQHLITCPACGAMCHRGWPYRAHALTHKGACP